MNVLLGQVYPCNVESLPWMFVVEQRTKLCEFFMGTADGGMVMQDDKAASGHRI